MDRRTFLKSTGAAAAGTATASLPANAAETPATPALVGGARELRLTTAWPLETPVYGDSVTRLVRRIETATGGRYRTVQAGTSHAGLAAIASGAADLYHAPEHLHLDTEPALAYFAALPAPFGLDAQSFQAWLVAGGGQMLWDDLAGDLGVKPLMAGHTGPAVGLWLNQPLPDEDGYRGLRLNLFGLAGQVLRQLGGEPHTLPPAIIAAALADGRLDGAEWAGPMANVAAGIHLAARHVVPRAFNPHGSAHTLGVSRSLWESLTESDRAIFEACAAEEVRVSIAEAVAHRRIAWKSVAERHGVVADLRPTRQPEALAVAARDTIAAVAASSPKAERIDASYRSFAELVRGRRRMHPSDRVA